MSAKIIDGKTIAHGLLESLKSSVEKLPTPPVLAIILATNNVGSIAYIKQKLKSAKAVGAPAYLFHFVDTITTDQLTNALAAIQQGREGDWQDLLLKEDEHFADFTNPKTLLAPDGLIVQRPLPDQIDYDKVIAVIDATKDLDGFHEASPFDPPVAEAVIVALESVLPKPKALSKDRVGTKKVAVVGFGGTGGKPISELLTKHGVDHTVIRSKTEDKEAIAKSADILISAVGRGHLVTPQWVKPGAILIDVGVTRVPKDPSDHSKGSVLAGDIDPTCLSVAAAYTPVPGGVGPINVACLMQNLVLAAQK